MAEEISRIAYFDDRFYKLKLSDAEKLFMQVWHKQDVDTIYLPSSTTMLGIISQPFLAKWRGDVGNEVADYRVKVAMQKGSNVHDGIEQLFGGQTLLAEKYPQDEWLNLCRFMEWHETFKPELIEAEHTVYSLKDLYAGTEDILCTLQGGKLNCGYSKPLDVPEGIYVGDWKTGKGISNSYFYQLASYVFAQEERAEHAGVKMTISGAFILHLQADTKQGWKCIIRNRKEIEEDYEAFSHSMALWKRENANLTPKVIDMPTELKLPTKEKENGI